MIACAISRDRVLFLVRWQHGVTVSRRRVAVLFSICSREHSIVSGCSCISVLFGSLAPSGLEPGYLVCEAGRGRCVRSGASGAMHDAMAECEHCGSKSVDTQTGQHVSRAYDRKFPQPALRRSLKILLVVGDCFFIGLQPILVYMAKVDGKFLFAPVSVNFLTEIVKIFFTLIGLLWSMRTQEKGEKSPFSSDTMMKAAKANWLLAVPAFLYAVNNYLKFTMQLYFQPSTVKMLGNLKVLVIALLLKILMRKRFSLMQWECLTLLLIGVSVNQLHTTSVGTTVIIPLATAAYVSTLMYVTVPSLASVYSEYFLKKQFDTNIHLQNLSLYGYGALFNLFAIFAQNIYLDGGFHLNILEGHSYATVLLICNNAAQGILSSFFFKYADTILKKYSSTVATIFTGLASYFLFGHALTINFLLGFSIVLISMHQYYSYAEKSSKGAEQNGQHLDSRASEVGLSKKNHSNLNEAMLKDSNLALPSHIIGVMGEREPLLSRTFSSPRVPNV